MRGLLIILDILIFAFIVTAHVFMSIQPKIDVVAEKIVTEGTSYLQLDALDHLIRDSEFSDTTEVNNLDTINN